MSCCIIRTGAAWIFWYEGSSDYLCSAVAGAARSVTAYFFLQARRNLHPIFGVYVSVSVTPRLQQYFRAALSLHTSIVYHSGGGSFDGLGFDHNANMCG